MLTETEISQVTRHKIWFFVFYHYLCPIYKPYGLL